MGLLAVVQVPGLAGEDGELGQHRRGALPLPGPGLPPHRGHHPQPGTRNTVGMTTRVIVQAVSEAGRRYEAVESAR